MTDNSEIADLRRKVEALERAAKPPEPFTPEPYQRFDPTAGMSMPRSAMEAMIMPNHVMQDIVREQRVSSVAQGPSAAGAGGTISAVHRSPGLFGTQNGWRNAAPIGPPPCVAAADRLMDHQDALDRAELIKREAHCRPCAR